MVPGNENVLVAIENESNVRRSSQPQEKKNDKIKEKRKHGE